jgi:hypothetical protein
MVSGVIMSRSEEEQSLTPKDSGNIFGFLNNDIVKIIASHLSVKDVLNLMNASIMTHNLFRSNLTLYLASKARSCVVLGDVDGLAVIAKHKPAVLFNKGQVTDLRERIFYNVSAYQLIQFLCDKDMKDKIKRLVPANLTAIRQAQEEEMDGGGYDLIKLDDDPLKITEPDFKRITEFKTTYILYNNEELAVTFSLLENPDGIIYYQDAKQVAHFYYANRITKEINKLNVCLSSEEDAQAWAVFEDSFVNMENNSGRRSSDSEHRLITKILQCQLQRKGLQYEQNGIRYCDSHSPFKLINAYRTCIRLCEEAENNGRWDKAHAYWSKVVGKTQGEEMWLLQRICEKERPFYPLPTNFDKFERDVNVVFYNVRSKKDESAVVDGKLVIGLGSGFGLYKGGSCVGQVNYIGERGVCLCDLVAISWLVKDAKVNIVEFKQEQDPDLQRNGAFHL